MLAFSVRGWEKEKLMTIDAWRKLKHFSVMACIKHISKHFDSRIAESHIIFHCCKVEPTCHIWIIFHLYASGHASVVLFWTCILFHILNRQKVSLRNGVTYVLGGCSYCDTSAGRQDICKAWCLGGSKYVSEVQSWSLWKLVHSKDIYKTCVLENRNIIIIVLIIHVNSALLKLMPMFQDVVQFNIIDVKGFIWWSPMGGNSMCVFWRSSNKNFFDMATMSPSQKSALNIERSYIAVRNVEYYWYTCICIYISKRTKCNTLIH